MPAYLNSGVADTAAAEISTGTEDGCTVVYTDSPGRRLGFVDITDPARPRPTGTLAVPGEPTSVVHLGNLLLAAVDTSTSFTDPSGRLLVVDARTRAIVRTLDLGGQPDSVAVAPSGRYLAVAIENQRDEDVADGALPQAPGGHLAVIDARTWAVSAARWSGTPAPRSNTSPSRTGSTPTSVPAPRASSRRTWRSAGSTASRTSSSTPSAAIIRELTVTKDGAAAGYDAEGVAALPDNDYWLAVEGSATKPDLLVRLNARGAVQQEVPLPAEVVAAVTANGLEGIAVDHDTFAVVERDNQRGPAAAIKKIYRFDVPRTWTGVPAVSKRLVKDLLPALRADHGWVQDKVEGLAIAGNGQAYAVTDNDAVDDVTGETVFLRLGHLF